MKFTRGKRIAFELLGPPLLGAILLYIFSWSVVGWYAAQNRTPPLGWEPVAIQTMGVVLIFSYLFAGLPSIIYTCAMEWMFNRGLNPAEWSSVALSTFLGFISGSAMVGVVGGFGWQGALAFYGSIGISAGFLLGLLIKIWSTEKKPTGESPP